MMTPQQFKSPGSGRLCTFAGACATALCIFIGACSSWSPGTQKVPDVVLPTAWSTTLSGDGAVSTVAPTSLVQWWQRFNDPLLTTLVTNALHANTTVRSAQAALQQSRALRDAQSAGLLLGVSASGSAQRGRSGGNDASNSFKAVSYTHLTLPTKRIV